MVKFSGYDIKWPEDYQFDAILTETCRSWGKAKFRHRQLSQQEMFISEF